MMWGQPIRSAAVAFGLLAGSITAASAQHPSCAAWQAELANLQGQRGGDAGAAQAARRAGAQLAQAVDQYRGMGCERGFSFFGDPPPPQCGRLRAQIGQLQEQYAVYQRQAEGGAIEDRRARLAAAIQTQCRGPQPRGFFETIFGIEPRRGEMDSTMPELDPEQQQEAAPRGGSYTVCVRSCDGFFFPLSNSPNGRGGQDEMCQALCPGADTTAFGMTNGGDIQNAVARSTGQPYSSLPNAGKFQKSFDASCTCKARNQSWSQVLRDAEAMLDKRRGDVIVTEQRAAELSRPRVDPKAEAARAKAAAAQAKTAQTVEAGSAEDKPMPSENSPTSGTESAGVGPQTAEGEKTLDKGDGLRRETHGVNGEKRTVRIVAPNLAPNLGPAAQKP